MNRLRNDFIEFSKENQLFSPDQKIQIACSGGSDSVAILLLLNQTKGLFRINLHCTHIDHGLRDNSASDSRFVENLCKRLEIAFTNLKINEKPSVNLENWARVHRRSLLIQNAKELRLDKTALAHNANDKAETLLHNIARGSGLHGAANMEPITGTIIRPLLFAQKNHILEYLSQIGQDYVIDETNTDTNFSRNRIRHNVIPQLEQIFPNAAANIARFASLAADDSSYLDQLAKSKSADVFFGNNLDVEKFSCLPKAIKRRIVRMLLTDKQPPSLSFCDDIICFVEESESGKLISFENVCMKKVSKNIVNVSLL
jgi:tRNA(Ile)-lysidine synthase